MRLYLFLMILIFNTSVNAYDDPRLALAASCVGETGWNGYKNGECAAILHIYLKLSKKSGRPLIDIAEQYSAAIKPRRGHPHRWKMFLNMDGTKPRYWPPGASWENYESDWIGTLDFVFSFLSGDIADPLPCANHFGARIDKPNDALKRLPAKNFKNYFYKIKYQKCKDK